MGGGDTINCSLWGGDEAVAAGLSLVCTSTSSGTAALKRKKSLWSGTDLTYTEAASTKVEGKKNPLVTPSKH